MTAAQIGYMTFPYDTKSTDLAHYLMLEKLIKTPILNKSIMFSR